MTAREAMLQALALLGYHDPSGDVENRQAAEILKKTVPLVNFILADVSHVMGGELERVSSANEELPISNNATEMGLVLGAAWLIAQAESDGTNQAIFASLYQQARGTLPRELERRIDVIPRPHL